MNLKRAHPRQDNKGVTFGITDTLSLIKLVISSISSNPDVCVHSCTSGVGPWRLDGRTLPLVGSELLALLRYQQLQGSLGIPHVIADSRVDHIRHACVVSPFLFGKFGKVHAVVVKSSMNLGFKCSTAVSDTHKHIIVSMEEKSDNLFW